MFLNISDRYVLGELLKPFFAGVVAFMIIMISNTLYIFAELIVKSNAGIDVVLKMILYSLPAIIVVTLPVAYMFATLLALGRLGRDSEIIALRACGVSLSRIIMPVIVLSLLISGIGFYIQEKTVPWANQQTLEVLKDMMRRDPLKAVKPKVFLSSDDRDFFVNDVDREKGELKEVYVLDQSGNEFPQIIAAETATREENIWKLNNGVLRKLSETGFIDHEIRFRGMEIQMEIKPDLVFNNQLDVRSLASGDAQKLIQEKKARGENTNKDELDYHTKFSLPLATFFTILLAAPIGIMFSKMGNYFGVAISIALVFVWYVTYSIFTSLGSAGTVSPLVAAWVQNVVFGGIGLILLMELSGIKVHRLVTAPFTFVQWRAPVLAAVPPVPAMAVSAPVASPEATETEELPQTEATAQEPVVPVQPLVKQHNAGTLFFNALRRPYEHTTRSAFVLSHLMVFSVLGLFGASGIWAAYRYAPLNVMMWAFLAIGALSGILVFHSHLILGIKRLRHLQRSPLWVMLLFSPLYPLMMLYLCFAPGKPEVPYPSARVLTQRSWVLCGFTVLLSLLPWGAVLSEDLPLRDTVNYFRSLIPTPPPAMEPGMDPGMPPPEGMPPEGMPPGEMPPNGDPNAPPPEFAPGPGPEGGPPPGPPQDLQGQPPGMAPEGGNNPYANPEAYEPTPPPAGELEAPINPEG